MTQGRTDHICSVGELIDKLCVENIKCHFFNHAIEAEQAKPNPDHQKISELLLYSQRANEQRVRLRDAINKQLAEAINAGHMDYAPTARTYGA